MRLTCGALLSEWEDLREDRPFMAHVMNGDIADLVGPAGGARRAEEHNVLLVELKLIVWVGDLRDETVAVAGDPTVRDPFGHLEHRVAALLLKEMVSEEAVLQDGLLLDDVANAGPQLLERR